MRLASMRKRLLQLLSCVLQPYLTDAREGSLLIRGLTLEEMERVLTEA